jgi:hypothetical protein
VNDATRRLFDDSGDHLDRFGLLLVLTVLSVTLNSLVDTEDPTSSLAGEIAWVATTLIVGATLIVAMRSSGVAALPLRYASIAVLLVVLSAIAVSIFASSELLGDAAGRPSVAWVVLTAFAPIFVTRRLFMQTNVTAGTIFGAVAAFLLIALAFDYIFLSLDQFGDPMFGEQQPTTVYMYFSLVTITTLGYGDFSPITEWSRYLASAEAVIGTMFLVTVVARLVSMFGSERSIVPNRRRSESADEGSDSAGVDTDTT